MPRGDLDRCAFPSVSFRNLIGCHAWWAVDLDSARHVLFRPYGYGREHIPVWITAGHIRYGQGERESQRASERKREREGKKEKKEKGTASVCERESLFSKKEKERASARERERGRDIEVTSAKLVSRSIRIRKKRVHRNTHPSGSPMASGSCSDTWFRKLSQSLGFRV